MIDYSGLQIDSVTDTQIEFSLASHNIMSLKVAVDIGAGNYDGDKIDVTISNNSCTIWEAAVDQDRDRLNSVQLSFDGNSEAAHAATLFLLAGRVISLRRDGITMSQIATLFENRIRAFGQRSQAFDLTDFDNQVN